MLRRTLTACLALVATFTSLSSCYNLDPHQFTFKPNRVVEAKELETSGPSPFPRTSFTLTQIDPYNAYIFGGALENSSWYTFPFYNDVIIATKLNDDAIVYRNVSFPNPSLVPSPRGYHKAAGLILDNIPHVCIFGGCEYIHAIDGHYILNEANDSFYCFNTNTLLWLNLTTNSVLRGLSPRVDHQMESNDTHLFVAFGIANPNFTVYNDMWIFDSNRLKWYNITPTALPLPSKRETSTGGLVYLPDGLGNYKQQFITYGGDNFSREPKMNDTWAFELDNLQYDLKQWLNITQNEKPRPTREFACSATDPTGRYIYMVDGDPYNPIRVPCSADYTISDVWMFDSHTSRWTQVGILHPELLPGLKKHSCGINCNPSTNNCYLDVYGGYNIECRAVNSTTWNPIQTFNTRVISLSIGKLEPTHDSTKSMKQPAQPLLTSIDLIGSIIPIKTLGSSPFPLNSFSLLAVSPDMAYLFGGVYEKSDGNNIFHNDVWIRTTLDNTYHVWTHVYPTGTIPSPRAYHSAVIVKHFMYILGGGVFQIKGSEITMTEAVDTMYRLDLDTLVWTDLTYQGGPSPRFSMHAGFDGSHIIVGLGTSDDTPEIKVDNSNGLPGCGPWSSATDIWTYSLSTQQWLNTSLVFTDEDPIIKQGSMSALIRTSEGSKMIVFGGETSLSQANETWMLRSFDTSHMMKSNDALVWINVTRDDTKAPSVEYSCVVALNNNIYSYGGDPNIPLACGSYDNTDNKLWRLDTKTYEWSEMKVSGSPLALKKAGCNAYCEHNGRCYMVISGGYSMSCEDNKPMQTFNPGSFMIQVS